MDPVSYGIQGIVRPPAATIRNGFRASSNFFGSVLEAGSLRSEVARLRALERSSLLYEERLATLNDDLSVLRALVKMPPIPNRTRIAAKVTMFFPSENRMTLNVGRNQGIATDMPVVTSYGLLGRVDSVGANSCQINIISSFQSRIGAVVVPRKSAAASEATGPIPPIAGLLQGDGPERLVLVLQDTGSLISPGDLVITSGYSEKIPRGIPIGRIVDVEKSTEFGSRRAVVTPLFQLGQSEYVWVIQ